MARDKFIAQRTWRCPDELRLAAFVEQRLAGPQRSGVEDHIAGCDYCLSQVGALARLREAAPPADVPPELLAKARQLVGGDERASFSIWRWGAAAAATACAALMVTLWIPKPRVVSHTELVRSRVAQAAALPELLFPRESAVVPRARLEFRWNRVERSLFYEVRVVSADGDVVWETRTEQLEARIPPDARLASGPRYYVSVKASTPEGKTLQSPVVGFQVASP